jgi:ubiquinone/menaquinone biosynthesis C-methylase UbiE
MGIQEEAENFLWSNVGDINGMKVLDIGCGDGVLSVRLAEMGATVCAIDISEQMLLLTRMRAEKHGVSDRIITYRTAAESTDFPSGSFSVILGNGVLHHLKWPNCLVEFKRILAPAGIPIFLEPLGHNPMINLYRKITPELRSVDEAPLQFEQFEDIEEIFGSFLHREFVLCALFAIPFVRVGSGRVFRFLVEAGKCLDRYLLRLSWLRKQAWLTVIVIRSRLPAST